MFQLRRIRSVLLVLFALGSWSQQASAAGPLWKWWFGSHGGGAATVSGHTAAAAGATTAAGGAAGAAVVNNKTHSGAGVGVTHKGGIIGGFSPGNAWFCDGSGCCADGLCCTVAGCW